MKRPGIQRTLAACVAAAAGCLLLLAGACGDDGETPTPTATQASASPAAVTPRSSSPTAGPTGRASPVSTSPVGPDRPGEEGFRAFLRILDGGLRAQGGLAIKTRWKTIDVTCKAADVPKRADGALCERAGQEYKGVQAGDWRSEWTIAPVENVNQRLDQVTSTLKLDATDRFGDGNMRVYATSIGAGVYKTVITAIAASAAGSGGPSPARVAWVVTWEFDDARWKATSILFVSEAVEEVVASVPPDVKAILPNWARYP